MSKPLYTSASAIESADPKNDGCVRRRRTHEEFVSEISHRPLVVLGTFTGVECKLLFRCTVDGNEWEARPANILQGKGCPKCAIRKNGELRRKSNKILEDHGTWLLIDISTQNSPKATMKLDKADLQVLERKVYKGKRGYPVTGAHNTSVTIHSLLNPSYEQTDHINRDRCDNRRANLRESTQQQNTCNQTRRIDNSSGKAGVSWDSSRNKWCAYLNFFGKRKNLGRFCKYEDAVDARKAAEKEYFAEFTAKGQ